jgi:hypothetical protein
LVSSYATDSCVKFLTIYRLNGNVSRKCRLISFTFLSSPIMMYVMNLIYICMRVLLPAGWLLVFALDRKLIMGVFPIELVLLGRLFPVVSSFSVAKQLRCRGTHRLLRTIESLMGGPFCFFIGLRKVQLTSAYLMLLLTVHHTPWMFVTYVGTLHLCWWELWCRLHMLWWQEIC